MSMDFKPGYCAHCQNTGFIDCYCGGDLCICENNGEEPCPFCDGMGEFEDEEYDDPSREPAPAALKGWQGQEPVQTGRSSGQPARRKAMDHPPMPAKKWVLRSGECAM